MIVFGIETSCDETAAAVVVGGRDVLSNIVYSQVARHQPYGGVVPEVASRCHLEVLPPICEQALTEGGLDWSRIETVAVTRGPGLASSLLVGVTAAKALSLRLGVPLLTVSHLDAHIYALFLGEDAPDAAAVCPLVALLVSGGHTRLIRMDAPGRMVVIGGTLDDAAGEALDKGAALLGLGYPGGPEIEKAARGGDPEYVRFPRAYPEGRTGAGGRDGGPALGFSFSGVKTALRYYLADHPGVLGQHLADVAASYQAAVFDVLAERLKTAVVAESARYAACVGGVIRNETLRAMLRGAAHEAGAQLLLADPAYCTDNAAMVAGLAGSGWPCVRAARLDEGIVPTGKGL